MSQTNWEFGQNNNQICFTFIFTRLIAEIKREKRENISLFKKQKLTREEKKNINKKKIKQIK